MPADLTLGKHSVRCLQYSRVVCGSCAQLYQTKMDCVSPQFVQMSCHKFLITDTTECSVVLAILYTLEAFGTTTDVADSLSHSQVSKTRQYMTGSLICFLAGAVLGICAALLWTTSGFIQFAYPEEKNKASVRYLTSIV